MPAALRATAALAILAAGAAAACTPWGATGAATRQRTVGLRLRGGSSQLAAYLLCRMGGNDAPSLDDVKGALESTLARVLIKVCGILGCALAAVYRFLN